MESCRGNAVVRDYSRQEGLSRKANNVARKVFKGV